MIKGARVPERAYHVVLWVVSIVFAGFIVGLGNLIIGDLPQVEERVLPETFVESPDSRNIRVELAAIAVRRGAIDDKLQIERLQLDQARRASQTATETFQAWIQARTATTNPQQDPEVLARTRTLEQLKANERTIQWAMDELDREVVPLEQRKSALEQEQARLQDRAAPARREQRSGRSCAYSASALRSRCPCWSSPSGWC